MCAGVWLLSNDLSPHLPKQLIMELEEMPDDEATSEGSTNWRLQADAVSGRSNWQTYAYCLLWSVHAVRGGGGGGAGEG